MNLEELLYKISYQQSDIQCMYDQHKEWYKTGLKSHIHDISWPQLISTTVFYCWVQQKHILWGDVVCPVNTNQN